MATSLSAVLDAHKNARLPHLDAVSFDALAPNFDHKVTLEMTEIKLTRAFRNTLKLLRSSMLVPREQDVVLAKDDKTIRRAPPWIPWLSLLHSWARRFCFLPGDCGDWDAMMFTQIKRRKNVGIELQFLLSNSEEPKVLAEREWFGDYIDTSPDRRFKWAQHKLCMCIAFRMPDNTVDWNELKDLYDNRRREVSNASRSQRLIRFLHDECNKVKCAHGVIMDSQHTLIVVVAEPEKYSTTTTDQTSSCQLFTAAEHSAVFCIAQILSKYSPTLKFRNPIFHSGAAFRKEGESLQTPLPKLPTRFRDFDYYELSEGGDYLRYFLDWKKHQSSTVTSLRVGHVLSVTGRYVLPRQMLRWRSQFPRYPLSKLERVKMNPWIKRRRTRDRTTDELLLKSPAPAFRVTEVIQDGPDHYSRVVRGQLQVPGARASSAQTLVLKLFDERLFPMKLENFSESDPEHKASFWVNFADQLLRREDSAYRRLRKLQGSLIPRYYGSHEVQLPDGRKVLGILLEDIAGSKIEDVLAKQTSYEEVKNLYSCIRGFIREINHCSITQTDWHADQIICEPHTIRTVAGGLVKCYRPVFLDFAFATQPSGRSVTMEYPDDVAVLGLLLSVAGRLEEDLQWFERDICE